MTLAKVSSLGSVALLLIYSPCLALANVGTLADSSGEVVAWGSNSDGQLDIPGGAFAAISAGDGNNNLGILTNGTIVAWGRVIPVTPSGSFTAISAGVNHNLGIRSDGTLAGWGNNSNGETDVELFHPQ